MRKLYVGFCDGRLNFYYGGDEGELPRRADLFTSYRGAKKSYEDVREVRLIFVKKKKSGRSSSVA